MTISLVSDEAERGAMECVRGGSFGESVTVKASGEWERRMDRRETVGFAASEEMERRVMRRWGRRLANMSRKYLETHLPILEGPEAAWSWVKYVLRELASPSGTTVVVKNRCL